MKCGGGFPKVDPGACRFLPLLARGLAFRGGHPLLRVSFLAAPFADGGTIFPNLSKAWDVHTSSTATLSGVPKQA
jgi:hypothetical protein